MENRPLVVAIFKRQAKVGAVTFESMGVNVDEIAELFVLLLTVTEFLDVRKASVTECHRKALTSYSTRKSEIPRRYGGMASLEV